MPTLPYRHLQYLNCKPLGLVLKSSEKRTENLVSPVVYRVIGVGVLTDSYEHPDTHPADYECLPECLDTPYSSSGDDDGAEGPATPQTSAIAICVAIRDLTVTNTVAGSPIQSSRTAEYEEQYPKHVDRWEALARAVGDSSEEHPFSDRHELSASSSSEEESLEEAWDMEDVVELAASDQGEGNSGSDDHAESESSEGLKSQASYTSPKQTRVEFAQFDGFREHFQGHYRDDDEEFFPYDISEAISEDEAWAEYFANTGDYEVELAGLEDPNDQLRAHHTTLATPNRPSPAGFHITSLPRSASFPASPQTSYTVNASKEEPEDKPAATPICGSAHRRRVSDSEVTYVNLSERYRRPSPTPSYGMPHPRLPPGLTETPEVIRHERYHARPGKCHHDSVLRFWIDESAPDRICDICGRFARYLWACNSDTDDWSKVPPQTEVPQQPAGPDTNILAEWMQKAIARGEYTSEQVQKLVDQKKQVLKCAAQDRAAQASREGRPSSTAEQGTAQAWFEQEVDRESRPNDGVPDDPSNGGPCRMMFCGQCHRNFVDRSFGHIDRVVNEPYAEPPKIPEHLYRPISDAAILREMRPTHWVRGYAFGLWWQEHRYSSGQDMTPVLRLALNKGWTENQFKLTTWWVYWQRRSDREVDARIRWLEGRTLEQMSSFSQSIADSRFIIPRSGERSRSQMARVLDPVLSISRHPIWEEDESQEGPVTSPGWDYSLGHRWQALSQSEHRELTRLFIEQRDAPASASRPTAPPLPPWRLVLPRNQPKRPSSLSRPTMISTACMMHPTESEGEGRFLAMTG